MINQAVRFLSGIIFVMVLLVSCANIPELKVNYRLLQNSDALKGKKVFLVFEDRRKEKDILGEGARKEYEYFTGNLSLFLTRENGKGRKIGVYDVPSLFMEVFKRKLENMGMEVISEKREKQVVMVIGLESFLMDLVDRKWTVKIEYSAELLKDEKQLARQMINGQAERMKILGHKQADRVMGDIFTDTVNKLDVKRLFEQAGL